MLNKIRVLRKFRWIRGLTALAIAALFIIIGGQSILLDCRPNAQLGIDCVQTTHLFGWETAVHQISQVVEIKDVRNCRGEPCRFEIDLISESETLTIKNGDNGLSEALRTYLGSSKSAPFVLDLGIDQGEGGISRWYLLVPGILLVLYGLWALLSSIYQRVND